MNVAIRHVDYDRIAPGYDRRFGKEAEQGRVDPYESQMMGALYDIAACALESHAGRAADGSRSASGAARPPSVARVLEVGCGTGHWLAGFSASAASMASEACYEPVQWRLFGLDLSAGMLRQAERALETQDFASRSALVRGRAEALPFASGVFDLVYCVNAIHHFDRQRAFVAEARRLLHPGGILAVIGNDPHGHRDAWYVYTYFEGTYETDLARFPSRETVIAWMAEAGFDGIERRLVHEIADARVGRAVLDDPFLGKDSCSQLALLSDAAYARGMQRIQAALARSTAEGQTLVFAVNLRIEALIGRVPV